MFDVGISEILVIAVVALVVIGPERLPRVARTVGTLLGRAQRYVADVKAEVNREMELEELRKIQTQMQDAARSIHQEVASAGQEMQTAVSDAEKELNQTLAAATATDSATASVPLPEVTPLSEPPGTPKAIETIVTAESGTEGSGSPATSDGAATAAAASPVADASAPAVAEASATPAAVSDAPKQSTLFPEQTIR
jgi:sec-independent protein translocase protein TatB